MVLKSHRQIVEQHFNRCLKEQKLTFQEARSIAKKYLIKCGPELGRAIVSFTSKNPSTISTAEISELLGVKVKRIKSLINMS